MQQLNSRLDGPAMAEGHAAPGLTPELQALVQAEVAAQLEAAKAGFRKELADLDQRAPLDKATLLVFSDDLDKLIAGLIVATGAAAAGLETHLFFSFWGLNALKKATLASAEAKRTLKQKLLARMTPQDTSALGVSRLNYFGAGSKLFRAMLKDQDASSFEDLMAMARDLGVKLTACQMSMEVMGVEREELVDGVEVGGVAAYLADAAQSKVTLFI